MLKRIFRASSAFRERFYRYLENTVDLKSGDRLVFVDLGYTGTAQMCLEPVLEAERDVTVEGIYVLAGEYAWLAHQPAGPDRS